MRKAYVKTGAFVQPANQESEYSIYRQLVPSELKLEEIIKANPPDFVYSFDFFLYLVQLTIEVPAKNKDYITDDGFVPFNSQILQGIKRNYRPHLGYLVKHGILDESKQYIPGAKSRSYRLSKTYLTNKLIEVVMSDRKLIRKIAKNYHAKLSDRLKYPELYNWFNRHLKIDAESALKHCHEQLEEHFKQGYYRGYLKTYAKIFKIKLLQYGIFWFKTDSFGNRLHTNLTNLDSDLKQFMTYDGQPLVSVDIKNSQPFMSVQLLMAKYPQMKDEINNQPTTGRGIMLVNHSDLIDYLDIIRYIGLVVNGGLYEFMEAEMRKEFGDKYFDAEFIFERDTRKNVKNDLSPRARVKKVMFQVFFSKNTTRTKEKKFFAKLFPNVMRVFEDYKGNKALPPKERHKELAKELQRTESHLMLDMVVKEISRLRPDIPLFTIHDSVVTTCGNEDFVKEKMTEIIEKKIGFAPQVATEPWQLCGSLALQRA